MNFLLIMRLRVRYASLSLTVFEGNDRALALYRKLLSDFFLVS